MKKPYEAVIVAIGEAEESSPTFPPGKRFVLDNGKLAGELPDDVVVQLWVCCRVDEPWTWRVLPGQHVEPCADCGTDIVVRVSERSPKNPDVVKLCKACALTRSKG